MKAIKLAALLIATTVATGMVVTDVAAYGKGGGTARGYSGKGCSKSPSSSARASSQVRGPGVSRSARDRGADADFGGGSAAMSPNRGGNGRD